MKSMQGPIQFTIFGNQEKSTANPIPYLRSTQNNEWTPPAKRYHAWKDFVRFALIEAAPDAYARELRIRMAQGKKPIELGRGSASMNINIHWASGNHTDPDNVWKGISDALFQNDREVSGCFSYRTADDKKAKVEMEIRMA